MKNYGDRGGCYPSRPSSEISIILHMIRKPNSIIVLLFIQNNSQFKNMAKTCLPPSIHLRYVHLQRSSSQCTFRFVQLRRQPPNSRRRPSSCLLSIILHMIRKPNSIIFYYSFKIIPSLKTCLKHAYLHRSIDVKFIFDNARLGLSKFYSPNSRCRPSSCLLAVLATFLVIFSPSFLLLKRVKCPQFSSSQPKQLNLVPRSSRLTVP